MDEMFGWMFGDSFDLDFNGEMDRFENAAALSFLAYTYEEEEKKKEKDDFRWYYY